MCSAFTDTEIESWVEYMQRSAHMIEDMSIQHGMQDWVVESRRRKWRFAGKLARQTDKRWSALLIHWKPTCGTGRHPGRPKIRWSDALETFTGGLWQQSANDEDLWICLEEGFCTRA